MTKKLQMVFTLDSGKTLTYSLADPKDGLTKVEVEAAMQAVIDKKAIMSSNGIPVKIKEASIKSTDEVALA